MDRQQETTRRVTHSIMGPATPLWESRVLLGDSSLSLSLASRELEEKAWRRLKAGWPPCSATVAVHAFAVALFTSLTTPPRLL